MHSKLTRLLCLLTVSTLVMTSCASGINSDEIAHGILLGQPSAPVEMVVYLDYKCPDCKDFYSSTLKQLEEAYVQDGRLKIRLHDFPLLADSNLSHNASWCAKEVSADGHRQYMDFLFADQNAGRLFQLKEYGKQLGFPESFATCVEEGKYLDVINTLKTKGRTESISRTPTIVINGERYNHTTSFFDFTSIIEQSL